MYVKYVTARFRCAISGNHARIAQAHDSLRELEADLDAWFKEHRSFAQRFRERIRKDATASLDIVRLRRKLFGNDNTLSNQRKKIVGESNGRQRAIIATHCDLQQAISKAAGHASRQLATSQEPLTLIVKLNEQNEIEQVYQPGA